MCTYATCCCAGATLPSPISPITRAHISAPRRILVSIGMADGLHICAELEPVEDDRRRLAHRLAHRCHILVEPIEWGGDQHSIVHRRADLNTAFGGEAARQAQHLGAVGLHGKVSKNRGLELGEVFTRQPKTVAMLPESVA